MAGCFTGLVHVGVLVAGVVLTGPPVGVVRDAVGGVQLVTIGDGRHDPRIHRQGFEFALVGDLAEVHAGGEVLDGDFDADLLQVLLDDLLDLFPHAVARGGVEFQRQPLPSGVTEDAVRAGRESGFLEQGPGPGGIKRILLHRVRVPGVPRRQVGVGHRLLSLKELLGDRVPIDAMGEGAADPHVLQQWVVEVEVDVLPDQPRLEQHLEPAAGLLVQLRGLVKGDSNRPDGINRTGEHVGDQRVRVGNEPPGNAFDLRGAEDRVSPDRLNRHRRALPPFHQLIRAVAESELRIVPVRGLVELGRIVSIVAFQGVAGQRAVFRETRVRVRVALLPVDRDVQSVRAFHAQDVGDPVGHVTRHHGHLHVAGHAVAEDVVAAGHGLPVRPVARLHLPNQRHLVPIKLPGAVLEGRQVLNALREVFPGVVALHVAGEDRPVHAHRCGHLGKEWVEVIGLLSHADHDCVTTGGRLRLDPGGRPDRERQQRHQREGEPLPAHSHLIPPPRKRFGSYCQYHLLAFHVS